MSFKVTDIMQDLIGLILVTDCSQWRIDQFCGQVRGCGRFPLQYGKLHGT